LDLIKACSIPKVWTKAVSHLEGCANHQDFDVFLNVENSTAFSADDLEVYRLVDKFLRANGGSAVETVAETIFPLSDYVRGGAKAVYENYPRRMNHIRSRRTDARWGTYALRLLEPRVDKKGRTYIPLKALVDKIISCGKYKASHELNLSLLEGDIGINDSDLDRLRPYGGPCLSHLSFKVYDGVVRVNATYRSHYYIQRLMGNLVGLARLLFFVAREAGLQPGPLTINSTYARLDTGGQNGEGRKWGEQDIAKLIDACRKVYADGEKPKAQTPVVAENLYVKAGTLQSSDV
jgi:hypothetical protein